MSSSNHDDPMKDNQKKRSAEAKTVRKIVAIVLAIVITVIAVVGITGYIYISSALEPVDPDDTTKEKVDIPIGSSVSQIASILEEENVIKDSRVFRFYVKFKNESGFQAGEYSFTQAMSLDELVKALKTGKVVKDPLLTVTIPEGKTVAQIADIYSRKTSIEKEDFMDKVNEDAYVESLIDTHPNLLSEVILDPEIRTPLEGYLFAATYDFYVEEPTIEQIVEKMLSKTEEVIAPYIPAMKEQGLTVHEAVTMASLVENEAKTKEDRQKIAEVFYNRLEEGMPLQTDPTVLYALGEHKDRVLYEDLEVESPYNTYHVNDLPIGPISNFAENAVEATVNPKESNNLYFLAASDGTIYYSETLDEHNRKKNKYIN
ncbi:MULTISPECIES: endolytic transglycosylase MltG [Pontibacillus]|uniref:Endolytic murein transglycosylase n=1 Tax=Pontibacillus chungwhensis TaxID=265426 RepID=A0ABY8UX17_9BACI|nr:MULTISPECIES: endolytic transglycosylase MltG [Pontibacillus]MCD5323667.1 endolytic transglycosylase MltG [Pontibacillus sp. HN14]WIF97034.1 endolytic transglycosylase MltG [Pontibacillus chungwhensis]